MAPGIDVTRDVRWASDNTISKLSSKANVVERRTETATPGSHKIREDKEKKKRIMSPRSPGIRTDPPDQSRKPDHREVIKTKLGHKGLEVIPMGHQGAYSISLGLHGLCGTTRIGHYFTGPPGTGCHLNGSPRAGDIIGTIRRGCTDGSVFKN